MSECYDMPIMYITVIIKRKLLDSRLSATSDTLRILRMINIAVQAVLVPFCRVIYGIMASFFNKITMGHVLR